jgi:hypothetical protein
MDIPQLDYLLNLLDHRRDEVTDSIGKLEGNFTDQFYLKQSKRYKKLEAERDMNATILIKLLNEKRRIYREEVIPNAG